MTYVLIDSRLIAGRSCLDGEADTNTQEDASYDKHGDLDGGRDKHCADDVTRRCHQHASLAPLVSGDPRSRERRYHTGLHVKVASHDGTRLTCAFHDAQILLKANLGVWVDLTTLSWSRGRAAHGADICRAT